MLTMNCI